MTLVMQPAANELQKARSQLVLLKRSIAQKKHSTNQKKDADLVGFKPVVVPSFKATEGKWDAAQMNGRFTPLNGAPPSFRSLGRPLEDPGRVVGYPSPARNKPAKVSVSPVAAPQDPGLDEPLVPCSVCNRKFKESRLEKHTQICKAASQQKRRQFDSVANRLSDLDGGDALLAKAKTVQKEAVKQTKQRKTSAKEEAIPEWRRKSLDFRRMILQAKAAEGDEDAAVKAKALQKELGAAGPADAGMLKCPHCGRTFNQEAGERHIAICVKTFGGSSGGGRLIKGGGRNAVKPAVDSPQNQQQRSRSGNGGGGLSAFRNRTPNPLRGR